MEFFIIILLTVLGFLLAIIPILGGVYAITLWVIFAADPDLGTLLIYIGMVMLVVSGSTAIVGFGFGNMIWQASNVIIGIVALIAGLIINAFSSPAGILAISVISLAFAFEGGAKKWVSSKDTTL